MEGGKSKEDNPPREAQTEPREDHRLFDGMSVLGPDFLEVFSVQLLDGLGQNRLPGLLRDVGQAA